VLLVACRLIQGIAVGGEWGGAVLMATEHSPPDKRGFYGSLVQIGFPLGMALGTASFFALAYLGDQQFMSWGWRIPFAGSAALVVIGIFIRLRIDETPDFKRVLREGNVARLPVLDTILHHPKDLMIGLGARITEISWIYVLTIFGLSYAVTDLGLSRNLVLGAIALGAAVELITIPLFGNLSDRGWRWVASPISRGAISPSRHRCVAGPRRAKPLGAPPTHCCATPKATCTTPSRSIWRDAPSCGR